MKIFSTQVTKEGSRIVSGSTLVNGVHEDVPFGQGIAISMLPADYQARLLRGEAISVEDLKSLNLGFVSLGVE